jgi:hypothetical protein
MNRMIFTFAALILLLSLAVGAHAAIITTTLGNNSPGFNDGDWPALIPDILNAQSGQPAPFDQGYGHEVLGPHFSGSWAFNYGALPDPILSANITIGIIDHDSTASGSQLALFTIDGNDSTSALDASFEGSGGTDNEYNVYTINLGAVVFADLVDGSVSVALDLNGPGLQTPLFPFPGPNPSVEGDYNAAHLIFSTLSITTQAVPIPATMLLLGSGLIGLIGFRRKFKK